LGQLRIVFNTKRWSLMIAPNQQSEQQLKTGKKDSVQRVDLGLHWLNRGQANATSVALFVVQIGLRRVSNASTATTMTIHS
tara:strand:+ start:139 stop:381 length:243 start_codon:yes stop_codon:yes gene_type:complete